MENTFQKKSRKKNKKPLYFLVGAILFFVAFIYVLARPSLQSKAIEQVELCTSVNDVKSVFDRYKFDLVETDENGKNIVSIVFQNAVRDKLSSFNLSDEQLTECLEWLPPLKTNLNVIVIPDLSKRIVASPDQIKNDLMVLEAIWSSFIDYSKFRQDTHDRLMIDVTDIEQAKGQFSSIADKLQFDLSGHRGKSNRLFFTDDKNVIFKNGIRELYESAHERPLGADYIFYFRRYLNDRLKKSTLHHTYSNKVIILTDGYLELQESKDYGVGSRWNYTVRDANLYKAAAYGDIRNAISQLGLNIPKAPGLSLENVELLVCEVTERPEGRTKDFEILKAYWEDWFERMNADPGNIKFIQREQSGNITKSRIKDFILQ